jgi:hypothetical protein
MHKVGIIRKASDRILRSVMNLVPDVATDGELMKISTKAINDLLRVITKIVESPTFGYKICLRMLFKT